MHHPDVSPEILHRVAVLTLYTCAPLAWTFVLALLVVAGFVVGKTTSGDFDLVLYVSAAGGFAGLPAFGLSETRRLVKSMLGSGKAVRRTMRRIGGLGALAHLTTLFGIPFAVGFLVLVYYSLR
jgi:hypothetical protein